MSSDVKTLVKLLRPGDEEQNLIDELVFDYTNMRSARARWEEECRELNDFIDATDTRTTTNGKLPFKNSTTINKLSQIHQNMLTAYMEYLIPNRDWISFEASSQEDNAREKKESAVIYVRAKAEESNLEGVLERLANDFLTRGICIAHDRHVTRSTVTVEGIVIPNYTGTITERIHPDDFLYDVTATSLETARKCIRHLYTMGSLKKHIQEETSPIMTEEQFQRLREERQSIRESLEDGYSGRRKYESLHKKGFGDMLNYINEGLVEVLHFYGDFYDEGKDELLLNHEIVVVDRRFIGRKASLKTWNGSQNLHVSVYDFRQDSLAPIGPMSRIVGLQYKLDKRENLNEDLHDKFVSPTLVKSGDVTEKGVRGGPNHEFVVEEGGNVTYLAPPWQVLQADSQSAMFTMQLMEDLCGAPKEAIGQRTPGEKTKFEVQLLDQGQGKLFRRKVKKFEREILTPVLQDYLEQGRRNLDGTDVIKQYDTSLGATSFVSITADDLNNTGKMVARGATIFAEKANALQNLVQVMSSPMSNLLLPHIDRTKLFRLVEELADWTKYDLFTFAVGLQDDAKLQRLASKVQDSNQASAMTNEDIDDAGETA